MVAVHAHKGHSLGDNPAVMSSASSSSSNNSSNSSNPSRARLEVPLPLHKRGLYHHMNGAMFYRGLSSSVGQEVASPYKRPRPQSPAQPVQQHPAPAYAYAQSQEQARYAVPMASNYDALFRSATYQVSDTRAKKLIKWNISKTAQSPMTAQPGRHKFLK